MKFTRYACIVFLGIGAVAASAGFLLSGSEAHIINVTAKIEPPMCDARSVGYWMNNEGCSQGAGSSNGADGVRTLSGAYSGAFASFTGGDMCAALRIADCASVLLKDKYACMATAQILALELNVASKRLHPAAFLAGADDGDASFDILHLFESSTVHEALITLEAILANESSSFTQTRRAAYVAERIIAFYENENPFHPQCVFDPRDLPACRPVLGDVTVGNENNAKIVTEVETQAQTGGNSAEGGTGGSAGDGGSVENSGDNNEGGAGGDWGDVREGGTVTTGDTEAETVVENEVNTNVTQAGCENCVPCEELCAEADEATEDSMPQEVQSEELIVSEEAGEEADPSPDKQPPVEDENMVEEVN